VGEGVEMTPESQKYLCTALLNGVQTDVYTVSDECGGWFYFNPDPVKKSRPRIKVGLDVDEWYRCLATLMHEAMEAVTANLEYRFRPSCDLALDNGSYMFVMTHTQFSEVVACAADFMSVVVPKLAKVWERKHRRRK
jgi:hypothetical protein